MYLFFRPGCWVCLRCRQQPRKKRERKERRLRKRSRKKLGKIREEYHRKVGILNIVFRKDLDRGKCKSDYNNWLGLSEVFWLYPDRLTRKGVSDSFHCVIWMGLISFLFSGFQFWFHIIRSRESKYLKWSLLTFHQYISPVWKKNDYFMRGVKYSTLINTFASFISLKANVKDWMAKK